MAKRLGAVMEIENDDLGLECYRRVRINLDVTKPLCRTLNVKGREGRVMEIKLAYERLPFFCFMCGVIGHSEKDCPNVIADSQEKGLGWDKSLRATPRKGVQKKIEEVEEIKARRKVLFVAKPPKLDKEEVTKETYKNRESVNEVGEQEANEQFGEMKRAIMGVDKSSEPRDDPSTREAESGIIPNTNKNAKWRRVVRHQGAAEGSATPNNVKVGMGNKRDRDDDCIMEEAKDRGKKVNVDIQSSGWRMAEAVVVQPRPAQ
ncbi:Zinc metalloprotease ZmpB [Bienertia sinuspersici]